MKTKIILFIVCASFLTNLAAMKAPDQPKQRAAAAQAELAQPPMGRAPSEFSGGELSSPTNNLLMAAALAANRPQQGPNCCAVFRDACSVCTCVCTTMCCCCIEMTKVEKCCCLCCVSALLCGLIRSYNNDGLEDPKSSD